MEFLLCMAVIVSVIWAMVATSEARSKRELAEEYRHENEKLDRKLNGKGSEVVVGFDDQPDITYKGVHTLSYDGDFTVLRDYDDHVVAKVHSRKVTYIHGVDDVKEAE